MKIPLLFLAAPLLAQQINNPQLGYIARDGGELRRIEGLSLSSRTSQPINLGPACTRVSPSPAMRWALCAVELSTVLIDLRTNRVQLIAESPFETAVWSPNAQAVVVDGVLSTGLEQDRFIRTVTGSAVSAVSDQGNVYSGDQPAAFDGTTLITASGNRITRGAQSYGVSFEPRFVIAGFNNIIYAAAGKDIARIDTLTGAVRQYELAAEATRLELLADGSLLYAAPGPDQQGWLFRDREGEAPRSIFIPGFPQ